jgi:hypothetical protein
MTATMAAYLVGLTAAVLLILGGLAARIVTRSRRRTRQPDGSHGRTMGMMFRFRRTDPEGRQWEPLRITVRELRVQGLRRWPEAPGVYVPHDESLHCRGCVSDPGTRARIVRRLDEHEQMLVLVGGEDESALVQGHCVTH